jgi:hypothetical protein
MMRRLLTAILGVLVLLGSVSVVAAAPASAASSCTAGHNPSGQSVYYCGVWLPSGGIPVYASTSPNADVVDHLRAGGTGNWFYCQVRGATASSSGYSSNDWARTVGDDHGATGYVPAVYYSGTQSYWAGMTACASSGGSGGTRCTAGTNRSGQNVFYCPVWLPSGGAPVYKSSSTSSGIVDHLNYGGDVNWFRCQQDGTSASAGGYTSNNWARTISDNHGATGYVPAVYFAGAQDYWAGMSPCGTPAPPPADGSCSQGTNPSGSTVYYCPVWLPSGGVPVYASTDTGSGVVGRLTTGGSANWFYCRVNGGTATTGGYSSSNWAKTLADNDASGYVPAIYFTGAQNYWPGLPQCGSSGQPPPPPPTDGGSNTDGKACGLSYTGLPHLTLKLMQSACRVTDPSDSLYKYRMYAWNGGHGSIPGPTYGSCDPKNGAPNDCHVDGFDCSGLVRYAYYLTTRIDALDGYTWGQYSKAMSMRTKAVIDGASRSGNSGNVNDYLSRLKPGDVLWYGQNAGQHVAIYLGNGKQMNAYQSGTADGITSVTTGDVFWGAVRFW